MLTMCMMLVPPQSRIVLLLEPNVVKEGGHGSVCGHGGEKIRASRDGIWKDVSIALSVLSATPGKKISKIFGPA